MKSGMGVFTFLLTLLSFSQHEDSFLYIDSDQKEVYSVRRIKFHNGEFRDETNTPNAMDSLPGKSSNTFMIKGKNWYIKEFGKYQLYLGPESFAEDSLLLHLDLAAKRSDLGFWNDTQTIYPYSYIYRPKRKIAVGDSKTVYVYEQDYYTYKLQDDIALTTIFFDPDIGIVKTFNLTTGTVVLKNYPYLDRLKLE